MAQVRRPGEISPPVSCYTCYRLFLLRLAPALHMRSNVVSMPFFCHSTKPSVRDDTRWGESRAGSAHLQVSGRARPPHVREQVRVATHLMNVNAVLLPVCQTSPYEGLDRKTEYQHFNWQFFNFLFYLNCDLLDLCFITGNRFNRKLNIGSFQYSVLLQDVLLWLIVAKRLGKEEQSFIISPYFTETIKG